MNLRLTDAQVERAAIVIDSAGAASKLEAAMDYRPQGRNRHLSIRTFLIGGFLAIEAAGSFKSTDIYHVLTDAISVPMQWKLGVRRRGPDGTTIVLSKFTVDYLTKTITKRLVYSTAGAAHLGLELTDAQREQRRTGLQDALDAILDGSLVDKGRGWHALDGSGFWSWGRSYGRFEDADDVRAEEDVTDAPALPDPHKQPEEMAGRDLDELPDGDTSAPADDAGEPPKRRRGASYDFDAANGRKTRKDGKREGYFGYVMDTAIQITPPGEAPGPIVVERMVVSPASTDVVAPSLELLDRMSAGGYEVTDICVDRHYSYKKVHRWADELRKRSISQHFDLRSDEQGFRDINGTRMTAGWLHCPATPDELAVIPRPGLGARKSEYDEFRAKVAERQSWALARDERTNAEGRARYTCPAMDGKRGCPLREGTVAVALAAGLPVVADPPDRETAPACCTNSSGKVTVRSDELRKHEQPHYWGSDEWKQAYDLRTYVEGLFGSLKNPDTEDVRRGFTKYVGLPLVSLGLVLAAAVCNVRHQRKFWTERDGRPDHPLLTTDPISHGWVELTEEQLDALDQLHGGTKEAA